MNMPDKWYSVESRPSFRGHVEEEWGLHELLHAAVWADHEREKEVMRSSELLASIAALEYIHAHRSR